MIKIQMKNNKIIKIIWLIITVFIISNFAYSAVEVFSNYDTKLIVDTENNFININKTLVLKNVYDVGIVPGQIEFKIAKGVDGSVDNLQVINVSAYDKFNQDINVHVRNTDKYSVIILDVFYPLLPGFEYEFYLNYKLSYEPGGIFFKSLQIPLRESTIPIEKGEFEVVLPENYHFTYLGDEVDSVIVKDNTATWMIKDNMPNSIMFEYSWIPVRFSSFKGSYLFWIVLNLLLLGLLYFEIKRELKHIKGKYGK